MEPEPQNRARLEIRASALKWLPCINNKPHHITKVAFKQYSIQFNHQCPALPQTFISFYQTSRSTSFLLRKHILSI